MMTSPSTSFTVRPGSPPPCLFPLYGTGVPEPWSAMPEEPDSNDLVQQAGRKAGGTPVMKSQVLVVEDHPDNLLVLQAILEHEGFAVRTACSGEEALTILQEEPGRVDLILSDVMMPGMSGYDLCRILRGDPRLAELPVILITAKRIDEGDALHGMRVGADDYLVRPIDPRLLVKKIQVQLDHRHNLAQWQERYHTTRQELDQRDWSTRMLVHDMRSPLSAALAVAYLLEASTDLTPQQRDLVGRMRICLDRQEDMLQDLLCTAAIQNGRLQLVRETFTLGDLVREQLVIQESAAMAGRLTIDVQGLDRGWRVNADRRLLGRVVANLLTNAIKFARARTTISIRLGPSTASVHPVADGVVFSIANEGEVIPISDQERIFQPFTQGRGQDYGRSSGYGLGLCFCQQIIRLHGGYLGVISPIPGSQTGAVFYFSLP
ncbi:MAG: hybrid sensor histidine kinase/response regulator [Thermodesulfobacteriota bacterium]